MTAHRLVGEVLELTGIFHGQHALDDVVPCQLRRKFRRRIAQNENLAVRAELAHGKRLFQIGDGEPAHTQFPEFPADRLISVAIGVGLHHRHILGLRRQKLLHGLYIMGQGVQVDLRPCTIAFLLFLFHDLSRSFLDTVSPLKRRYVFMGSP